jgi:hypothetical protein
MLAMILKFPDVAHFQFFGFQVNKDMEAEE